MRAIITVNGKDQVGILARVATSVAEVGGNIVEVSQTVEQGIFSMFMLVEIDHLNIEFPKWVDSLEKMGASSGLSIHCMNEDVFTAMHHI